MLGSNPLASLGKLGCGNASEGWVPPARKWYRTFSRDTFPTRHRRLRAGGSADLPWNTTFARGYHLLRVHDVSEAQRPGRGDTHSGLDGMTPSTMVDWRHVAKGARSNLYCIWKS